MVRKAITLMLNLFSSRCRGENVILSVLWPRCSASCTERNCDAFIEIPACLEFLSTSLLQPLQGYKSPLSIIQRIIQDNIAGLRKPGNFGDRIVFRISRYPVRPPGGFSALALNHWAADRYQALQKEWKCIHQILFLFYRLSETRFRLHMLQARPVE